MSNPFPSLLVDHLPEDVSSEYWSWRRGLLGGYDVLHFQWPENLVSGERMLRVWTKRMAFLLLLLRLRLGRKGVVQTVHNIEPHEARGPVERMLLRWQQRCVHVRILLNDAEPAPPMIGTVTCVIAHGDYAPKYAVPPAPGGDPGSILYFGLIRSYKQVPLLVREFVRMSRDGLRLNVLGKPMSGQLHKEIIDEADGLSSVRLLLDDIDEDELVVEILRAGLVVLPYAKLYNSGALLLALTLKTPVLVPATPTTMRLRAEVGGDWVMTYDGALTSNVLDDAIDRAAGIIAEQHPGPDLSGRAWPTLGSAYADAYRIAAAKAKRRTRDRERNRTEG